MLINRRSFNEVLSTLKDVILMNRKGFADFARAIADDTALKAELANGWDESRVTG